MSSCATSISAVRVDLCNYWRSLPNVIPIAGTVSALSILLIKPKGMPEGHVSDALLLPQVALRVFNSNAVTARPGQQGPEAK